MLHAKARWPSAIEINLWPNALCNANKIRNTLPNKPDGSSPIERFAKVNVAPKLTAHHTFGCPVYAWRDNTKKWDPRAQLGINLGPSPRHAGTVSLILNLQTGNVSPQFHVQYDDFFETVRPSSGNPTTFSQWQLLSGIKATQAQWRFNLFGSPRSQREPSSRDQSQTPIPATEQMETHDTPNDEVMTGDEAELHVNDTQDTTTRSGRTVKMTDKMKESLEQRGQGIVSYQARTYDDSDEAYYDALHEDDYALQDAMDNPIAFLAQTDADTMYFDQAMQAPDRKEFIKAAIKEVNDHIDRKHWELIPRKEVPKDVKILPAVWSMKRKRDIKTRKVYKWKARLNVHGGKQEYAVNYFETYAPVVTWYTVRLLLILSILLGWHT